MRSYMRRVTASPCSCRAGTVALTKPIVVSLKEAAIAVPSGTSRTRVRVRRPRGEGPAARWRGMTRFTRRGRARLCSVAKKARSHSGIGGRLARMPVDRAFLGRVRLFEGLEDDTLDDVLSAATPRRVPAGFALFEQGE